MHKTTRPPARRSTKANGPAKKTTVRKPPLLGYTAGGKPVYGTEAPIYRQAVHLPKHDGDLTMVNNRGKYTVGQRVFPDFTQADHLDAAQLHADRREKLAAEHGRTYRAAVRKYGEPARIVSGGVGDNFPAEVNDRLRHLAHLASAESGASYAHYTSTRLRTPYFASKYHPGRLFAYTK